MIITKDDVLRYCKCVRGRETRHMLCARETEEKCEYIGRNLIDIKMRKEIDPILPTLPDNWDQESQHVRIPVPWEKRIAQLGKELGE